MVAGELVVVNARRNAMTTNSLANHSSLRLTEELDDLFSFLE
jgi:hypothetical protein